MNILSNKLPKGGQESSRKKRKPKAEYKAEHGVFLQCLGSGKAPLEICRAMHLTKAQYKQHLLDAFEAEEITKISCNYAAEPASAFPVSVRKMLNASPDALVKCEVHEPGDGKQIRLSILPVGATAANGPDATGCTAQ